MIFLTEELERLTRFELALRAWKALVLPLHHSRSYQATTGPDVNGISVFLGKARTLTLAASGFLPGLVFFKLARMCYW